MPERSEVAQCGNCVNTTRLAKIAVGCTVAMLVPTIILGWWAIDRARGVAKWSERADRFPTISELRGPPIPDEQNAALVYLQAFEALDLSQEQRELLDDEAPSPEPLAEIVTQNRKALELLHRAARMTKCRFEPVPDPENEPLRDLPYSLRQLRDTQKMLRARVLAQVAADDISGALATVEDEVRLAGGLLNEPYGILQYVGARSHLVMSARSLEVLLDASGLHAGETGGLRSALGELEPGPALTFALNVETAQGIEVLDYAQAHPDNPVIVESKAVGADNPLWAPFIAWNRANFVREAQELIDICRRPWREIADQPEDLPRHNPGYLYTALLLQTRSVAAHRDEMLALREMMRVALDIEAFIAEHGRPPEALDELIEAQGIEEPDYALDVFSGERLRFRPGENGGYTLWSIGRDLEEDGGVSYDDVQSGSDRAAGDRDLVFRVDPKP